MVTPVTAATGRRVGVFGGTFDPPHIGHLVAAIDVRDALCLDVVLLVVANEPWQKTGEVEVSAASHRLAMVRAAVADREGLEVSDIEIRRGGETYTADTLVQLAELEPTAELHVVVGRDAAAGFTTWKRHREVARAAHLVVVDRPGGPSGPRAEPPGDFEWTRVEIPELEISSTELRRRVKQGRSIDYLVPPGVATYIEDRDLYR